MTKEICFVGSKSKIGSRLIKLLKVNNQILPIELGLLEINENNLINIKHTISRNIENMNIKFLPHRSLVFCHRIRNLETNSSLALSTELKILEGVISSISKYSEGLNIIIIGSCTGSYFDKKSSQAYHHVKDFQKSFIRFFSNKNTEHYINMIELSYFDKYYPDESDKKYESQKRSLIKFNNDRQIPSYSHLALAVNYLSSPNLGLTGQIISLDNGILNVQKF